MKPNTALCLALAGMGLWLVARRTGRRRGPVVIACGAVVVVVGLATLAEYAFGLDLRIDELLFEDLPNGVGTPAPGRMAPSTALCLVTAGALLVLLERHGRLGWPAQLAASGGMLLAFLNLVGYVYRVPVLNGYGQWTWMALHTALALMVLTLGIVAVSVDNGPARLFVTAGQTGLMLRRLIPTAVLVPFLLGWLRLSGQRLGVYGTELGTSLLVIAMVVLFVAVLLTTGRALARVEAERAAALVELERRAGALAASQRRLQDSEDRLIQFLEGLPVGVFVVDASGKTVYANRYSLELLGHGIDPDARPEDLSKVYQAYVAGTDQLYPTERSGIRQALRGEAGELDDVEVLTTNGRRPLWVQFTPIRDQSGAVAYALSSFIDVTEQRRAARQLAERAEELRQSNAELEQFAYVASHDLAEPLRTIAGYVELLARRYQGRLDAEADRFIGHVVDGCTRMRSLIEGLLAYSRVGRSEQQLTEVDCDLVVADILANLENRLDEAEATVEVDALPTVRGNALQLAQLFQNLVTNAVKFARPGTPPRVRISACRDGTRWRFLVADNGIGIEPPYRERIFGMFQRLHTRDAYPGTGIGLAICKRIVQAHGGVVWVDDNPGGGTRFWFTLDDVQEAACVSS